MNNREIKFRFWDNGCMIYPNYWGCGNMGWFYGLPWEDDTYADIAMQYTGLKDKNGKEIYEGDIIEHPYADYERPLRYEVKFSNGRFNIDDDQILCEMRFVEVIGNIYEHEHLLK